MPKPITSLATLRPDIAGCLTEFDLAMDRMGFIGLRVLPVLEVAKQAGTFGIIPVEQLLTQPETRRASGSGYNRGGWKFDDASYATKEHGWEEPIDARDAAMYADYFNAELISTQRALDIVLRAHEKRVADAVFNATTFAALTAAVATEWSSYDDATPIDNVETAVRAVWTATGIWPNSLVINRTVFRNLRMCAQIIDRIQSAGAGNRTLPTDITPAMLAQVFDLEQVLVAGSAYNAGKEGAALDIEPLWSNEYAMVCKTARTQDFREPCLGRTFHWGEDGSAIGGTIETYYEEQIRGDVVRVRHETDEKMLYAQTGYLLSNITA